MNLYWINLKSCRQELQRLFLHSGEQALLQYFWPWHHSKNLLLLLLFFLLCYSQLTLIARGVRHNVKSSNHHRHLYFFFFFFLSYHHHDIIVVNIIGSQPRSLVYYCNELNRRMKTWIVNIILIIISSTISTITCIMVDWEWLIIFWMRQPTLVALVAHFFSKGLLTLMLKLKLKLKLIIILIIMWIIIIIFE